MGDGPEPTLNERRMRDLGEELDSLIEHYGEEFQDAIDSAMDAIRPASRR
jgi:type II secretory pathway component PulF